MRTKSLDGLRGLAAFNVVVCHFVAAFLPALLYRNYPTTFPQNVEPSVLFEFLSSPLMTLIYNGHFAVLIFFVLSGYVLTIPYFKNGNVLTLKRRFWGRYIRLNIPIAAAVSLSFLVYKLGLYSNSTAAEFSGSIPWLKSFFSQEIHYKTAVSDALYQSIVFGSGTLVPPLWTLKIEFIGSLYLLCFYIVKPKQGTAILSVAVSLFLYGIYKGESIYYIAIFSGALINIINIKKTWVLAVFFAGIYFGGFQFHSPYYDFLPSLNVFETEVFEKKNFYNTIGAILLVSAIANGFARSFLESRISQFLGEISFSLYLVHFIVLCSVSCAIYLFQPQHLGFLFANFVVYIIFAFVLAKLFQRYADKLSVKLSHKFSAHLFRREEGI